MMPIKDKETGLNARPELYPQGDNCEHKGEFPEVPVNPYELMHILDHTLFRPDSKSFAISQRNACFHFAQKIAKGRCHGDKTL